jgi:phospholipase/carboxylesterase
MIHRFIAGANAYVKTLLLLHGTGGTENDLIDIAKMIDPQANLLAVRGEEIEQGMTRFFKRLSPGVFDEKNLEMRTIQLYEFVNRAAIQYNFDRNQVIALGYSNGANIAASMLFHIDKCLAGAILLHPMVPRRGLVLPNMNQVRVLITAGTNDSICPPQETQELKQLFDRASAKVSLHWFDFGHRLSSQEIEKVMTWYRESYLVNLN